MEVGPTLLQGGLAEGDKAFPTSAVSVCRQCGFMESFARPKKGPLFLPHVVRLFTVVHPVKTALKENKNQK